MYISIHHALLNEAIFLLGETCPPKQLCMLDVDIKQAAMISGWDQGPQQWDGIAEASP